MQNAEKILKKHHLRITQFRVDVVNIFHKANHAMSANDIEKYLENPDRITLYRTIKSFEEKGIIHKAIDGTNTPKFALCDDHCDVHDHHDSHVHFHCENCENTFCLDEVIVPSITVPKHLKANHTSMIVNGLCDKCH